MSLKQQKQDAHISIPSRTFYSLALFHNHSNSWILVHIIHIQSIALLVCRQNKKKRVFESAKIGSIF